LADWVVAGLDVVAGRADVGAGFGATVSRVVGLVALPPPWGGVVGATVVLGLFPPLLPPLF
jgi:hypothetical protein